MTLHHGEVLEGLIEIGARLLLEKRFEKLLLIDDIEAKFRFLAFQGKPEDVELLRAESQALDPENRFWTNDIWDCNAETGAYDKEFYEDTFNEGVPLPYGDGNVEIRADQFRCLDRTRSRSSWFQHKEPIWDIYIEPNPPVIVFYSFKGGMGRTTTLASQAIGLANEGKRVAVVDMDFDAPGAGILFSSQEAPPIHYGVVDALIEKPEGNDILDYCYRVMDPSIKGLGEIHVFPAGYFDNHYLSRLAKLDLEVNESKPYSVRRLIEIIRDALKPDIILIDARAGLADSSGLLLNGLAHLYVLLSTASAQSKKGMETIVRHIGIDRIQSDLKQADCKLLYAMAPQDSTVRKAQLEQLTIWAEDYLSQNYYLPSGAEESGWTVDQINDDMAPHKAIAIDYNPALATFTNIVDVLSILAYPHYMELLKTIELRFADAKLWQQE